MPGAPSVRGGASTPPAAASAVAAASSVVPMASPAPSAAPSAMPGSSTPPSAVRPSIECSCRKRSSSRPVKLPIARTKSKLRGGSAADEAADPPLLDREAPSRAPPSSAASSCISPWPQEDP